MSHPLYESSMNQHNNDENLRATLRAWKETSPLPPRFQEQVWSQIEKAEARESRSLWNFLKQLELLLARPALAASYVALLLFVGIGAGYWQTQQKTADLDATLAFRYVQAVDPYQKANH